MNQNLNSWRWPIAGPVLVADPEGGQIAYIVVFTTLALLFELLVIVYYSYEWKKERHSGSRWIGILGTFVATVLLYVPTVHDFSEVSDLLKFVISSYAVQVGKVDLADHLAVYEGAAYASCLNYFYVAVIIVQIIDALILITALLTLIFRSSGNFLKNFARGFRLKTKIFIFTDLPYSELQDFLQRQKKGRKKIYVVFEQDLAKTQEGQENHDSYIYHGFVTLKGSITEGFIEGKAIPWWSRSRLLRQWFVNDVRFYCCFKSDRDNLNFADQALAFSRDKSWEKLREKQPRRKVHFYISYQDADFEKRYNYSYASGGMITFFSEYDWVSTSFIFRNPAMRLMKMVEVRANDNNQSKPSDANRKNQSKSTDESTDFNVDLIGFGGVNSEMLKKLVSAYYIPDEDQKIFQVTRDTKEGRKKLVYPKVSFHIYDKNIDEKDGENILKGMFATQNFVSGDPEFLPQYDLSKVCSFYNRDIDETAFREKYIDELAERQKEGKQTIVIISLGSSHYNIAVATKLRELLQQRRDNDKKMGKAKSKSASTDEDSKKKQVIFYPYLKEENLFIPDRNLLPKEMEEAAEKIRKERKLALGAQIPIPDEVDGIADGIIEARRFYVFNIDEETIDLLDAQEGRKGGKLSSEEKEKKRIISECLWMREDYPVVPFGRGGYFPDEEQEKVFQMAKGATQIYSSSLLNNKPVLDKDVDESWQKGIVLPSIAKSNYYLAISVGNKLRMLGFHLKPLNLGKNQKKLERLHEKKDSALADRKKLAELQESIKELTDKKNSASKLTQEEEKKLKDEQRELKKREKEKNKLPEKESKLAAKEKKLLPLQKIQSTNNSLKELQRDFPPSFNCYGEEEEKIGIRLNLEKRAKEMESWGLNNSVKALIHWDELKSPSKGNSFRAERNRELLDLAAMMKKRLDEIASRYPKYFPDGKFAGDTEKDPTNKNPDEIDLHIDAFAKDGIVQSCIKACYLIGWNIFRTDEGEKIAASEHIRWYFTQSSLGIIPYKKENFLCEENYKGSKGEWKYPGKFLTKNALKSDHGCMTTVKGIRDLQQELLRILPYAFDFLRKDFAAKMKKSSEPFEKQYKNFNKALYSVFELCYWADTFSISELKKIIDRSGTGIQNLWIDKGGKNAAQAKKTGLPTETTKIIIQKGNDAASPGAQP